MRWTHIGHAIMRKFVEVIFKDLEPQDKHIKIYLDYISWRQHKTNTTEKIKPKDFTFFKQKKEAGMQWSSLTSAGSASLQASDVSGTDLAQGELGGLSAIYNNIRIWPTWHAFIISQIARACHKTVRVDWIDGSLYRGEGGCFSFLFILWPYRRNGKLFLIQTQVAGLGQLVSVEVTSLTAFDALVIDVHVL